jgi:hypothetical protein
MNNNNTHGVLKAVLWVIAVYHLAFGAVLLTGFNAENLARSVLGATVEISDQVSYMFKPLGIYTIAFGALALLTALDPTRHRPMLIGIMALYILRLLNHLLQMNTLHEVFKVPDSTSYRSIGILAVIIILLAVFWPRRDPSASEENAEPTERSKDD